MVIRTFPYGLPNVKSIVVILEMKQSEWPGKIVTYIFNDGAPIFAVKVGGLDKFGPSIVPVKTSCWPIDGQTVWPFQTSSNDRFP